MTQNQDKMKGKINMKKRFFDFSDGDYVTAISNSMAMDSEGRLMTRMSDNMAMDMESGDIHIVSSWSNDDDDE